MTAENLPSLDSEMPASPGAKPMMLFAQIICGPRHSSRWDFLSTSMAASTSSPAANSLAMTLEAEPFQLKVCTEAASSGVTSIGVPPSRPITYRSPPVIVSSLITPPM